MDCPTCGTAYVAEDNFCRHCGASLPGARLPVVVQPAGLPVPWHDVRRSLIRATAALAVGTAIELMRRQVQRRMSPGALADRVEALVARRRPPVAHPQSSTATRISVQVVPEEPGLADMPGNASEVTVVRSYFFQRIRIRR